MYSKLDKNQKYRHQLLVTLCYGLWCNFVLVLLVTNQGSSFITTIVSLYYLLRFFFGTLRVGRSVSVSRLRHFTRGTYRVTSTPYYSDRTTVSTPNGVRGLGVQ